MNALGIFAYILTAGVVAGFLTLVVSLFRKVEKADDFRSWRVMLLLFAVCLVAPYGLIEAQTKIHAQDYSKAIAKALDQADVTGKLDYYKVINANDLKAELVVVAKEKTTINPAESCVMKMQVENKGKKGWKVENYEFVDSFKRNKDGFTFPPFW